MKLDVPYYSQYLDISDAYWSPRACGFCCIKMIANFHNIETPEITEIADTAKQEGGYGEHGIIHDWSVGYLNKIGLSAGREEKMCNDGSNEGILKLISSLKNKNPVIVSVARERDGKKAFHQVVVTGFEEKDNEVIGFYINDSASKIKGEGKDVYVPLENFLKEWRAMAIFAER